MSIESFSHQLYDHEMNKANLLAIISILLWCFSGICFRKGAEIMSPMLYLAFITGIGVITAVIIQGARGKRISSLFILPRKVVIAGIPGVTVYTIFLAQAFAMAKPEDIGLINLLNYFWPMWLVLLEIFFFKRKPKFIVLIAGFFLALSGLILAGGSFSFAFSGEFIPHLLALSGALFWAFYSVLLKVWSIPEEQSGTAFHFSICCVSSLGLALLFDDSIKIDNWNVQKLLWILFGGIGPVGIAYYLWELGVKGGSVTLIASISYFIPIGSSLLIALFFNEALHLGLLPGAILIAFGAFFVNKSVH